MPDLCGSNRRSSRRLEVVCLWHCTDGIAIAWAVSEELIGLGAYTLFATHFTALSQLAELYANAQLWHFTVDSSAWVGILGCLSKPSQPGSHSHPGSIGGTV